MNEGKSAATPTDDAFEAAWREYNANGNAGGWERVAFISGFGKGFKAGSVAAPKVPPDESLQIPYEPIPGCGHPGQYAYTEDGGKHIVCLVCEFKEAAPKVGETPQGIHPFRFWCMSEEGQECLDITSLFGANSKEELADFLLNRLMVAFKAGALRGAGETPAERWIPVEEEFPRLFTSQKLQRGC